MKRSAIPVILIGVTLLLLVSSADKRLVVHAANATDFSYAGSEIENAYAAIYQAENNHGNISQLIKQLNNATQLLNKARAENSSNLRSNTCKCHRGTSKKRKRTSISSRTYLVQPRNL